MKEPKAWHSRGYLPHFDHPEAVQSITFRLVDAVPASVLGAWRVELDLLKGRPAHDPEVIELRNHIERFMDQGHGACWLEKPEIAALVEGALLHFDSERYRLLAWTIMPNHVHVLVQAFPGFPIGRIVHSWKSFTANQANRNLHRNGEVWQADYFDRFIRDEAHFAAAKRYIEENPVKAGLAAKPEDWPWGSAERSSP